MGNSRRLACVGRFGALAGVIAFLALGAAASAEDVVKIEEHWELQVGGPDAGRSAPQVSMVMSPQDNLDGDFFVFTLNHWSHPAFSAGGMQVQRWNGEQCMTAAGNVDGSPLSADGETISWVQTMSINDGVLTFEVVDGHSDSWGVFGGSGQLKSVTSSDLGRLNNYRPAVSLEGSGIGYAGNRVSSLTLQKLVWYEADGDRHELNAPIDIATDIDP